MEPSQYVRLLKQRWLFLFLCVAIGASVGYASTLLNGNDEPEGPVVTHWTAGEVLVANNSVTETGVNLQRVAVFATAGEVPAAVAADRGVPVEQLAPTLRTVSDSGEGKITISAVATSAETARDVADEITDELLVAINTEAEAEYEAAIEQLTANVDEILDEVTIAEAEIDFFFEQADEDGNLTSAQQDDLRRAQARRDSALTRLAAAENELAALQDAGAPESPLERLDSVVPFRISQREFNGRIEQGRQGQNNLTIGEVDLADTSSPTVSERLESPMTRALLGWMAGLIIGIIIVLVHARLDPRIRSKDQAEAAFLLPVLADIPVIERKQRKNAVLHALDLPRSAVAEAYRYLRSVLLFARSGMDTGGNGLEAEAAADTPAKAQGDDPRADREVRVVMVTSPGEGEGKTTTATNLAVLMAEAGYDTLLVNCDFRLPTAHKALGVDYKAGTVIHTRVPNLRFVADVERTPDDTPGQVSERQRRLISRARNFVDLVILDTAPVLATNDAIDVLPETDLVVLVAREAKTTRTAARDARELLMDRMGVPVAGVVLTNAGAGMGVGYYEKYRYGSYFDPANDALWKVGKEAVAGKGKKEAKKGKKEGRKARKAAAAAAAAGAASVATEAAEEAELADATEAAADAETAAPSEPGGLSPSSGEAGDETTAATGEAAGLEKAEVEVDETVFDRSETDADSQPPPPEKPGWRNRRRKADEAIAALDQHAAERDDLSHIWGPEEGVVAPSGLAEADQALRDLGGEDQDAEPTRVDAPDGGTASTVVPPSLTPPAPVSPPVPEIVQTANGEAVAVHPDQSRLVFEPPVPAADAEATEPDLAADPPAAGEAGIEHGAPDEESDPVAREVADALVDFDIDAIFSEEAQGEREIDLRIEDRLARRPTDEEEIDIRES